MNYMDVPIGAVIPFLFDTFAGATGASITLSDFTAADVKIKKGTALTAQPTPGSGIALLGTNGIDEAGVGIHGFSIDTGNTTDSGYFAVGSYYNVIVDAVTIDTQTVRFIAGAFRLLPAEATAGYQSINAALVGNSAPETAAGVATATRTEMDSNSTDLNAILVALTAIATDTTDIAAIKVKTDALPGAPAAVGSAMALTVTERDAIAAAHMALVNGVVTGISPGRALRLLLGANAGKLAIAGGNVNISDILQTNLLGIQATTDASGQRLTVDISGIT